MDIQIVGLDSRQENRKMIGMNRGPLKTSFFIHKKIATFETMKLIQKQGSRSREFEIIGTKLYVKTKSMGEKNEYSIDIENLGEERHYKTHSRLGPRIVGIFFYVVMVIAVFGFFMEENLNDGGNILGLILGVLLGGGIGSLAFFAKMRNELHLVNGSAQLMFLLDNPSKKEMEVFIEELIRQSRKVILRKYSKVDPDLPENIQIQNFYWLKERGLISEKDYEDLKQEYKNQRLMR